MNISKYVVRLKAFITVGDCYGSLVFDYPNPSIESESFAIVSCLSE